MENLVEIHMIVHNEEVMLQFVIDHWKRMFRNPVIVVHDNESTDQSIDICLKNGCIVENFTTDGMNDTIHAQIKSDAVKNCKAKWCIVVDCDEVCLISEEDLLKTDCNIFEMDGWEIFDNVVAPYLSENKGISSPGYSKPVVVKVGDFELVQYAAGAHSIDKLVPKAEIEVKWNRKEFKLLHYKHWSLEYSLGRAHYLAKRQSVMNKSKKHSYHFGLSDDIHKSYFAERFKERVQITDKYLS
jgi:glycosyltransferase involved in cell wall biosynthesis